MEQLSDGTFSKTGNPDEFKDILNNLLYHDRYLTFADYDAYIMAQDKVNATYMVSCFYIFWSRVHLPRNSRGWFPKFANGINIINLRFMS